MNRFESHLKKNLLHVHKNLYLAKDDEHYYEKILRYHDPSSPEAHYHLGLKWEQKGAWMKAYKHYQQAATVHSPYYFKAKKASRLLEEQFLRNQSEDTGQTIKRTLPVYVKVLVFALLFINVCLLALFLFYPPLNTTISSTIKKWNTGADIVYEAEDLPYVIYFPIDTPREEIEAALHDQVIQLGSTAKNKNILLYGVVTTDDYLNFQTLPLKNDSLIDSSFVRAEYNSTLNDPVKIRFLQQGANSEGAALQYIGVNIVRTALQSYIEDKGAPPEHIGQLASDYPDNYLSYIPIEVITGTNSVTDLFTGQGGWVYNPHASQIADMFYPNAPANPLHPSPVPFSPITITIDKSAFSLIVSSPPYILSAGKIGTGKNDSTPEGSFPVLNRVLEPKGEHPGMFGTAALGMGEIAIHGTSDEQSIQNTKSHGCIRMTNPDIQVIFDFVPKGTMVTIHNQTPDKQMDTLTNHLHQLVPGDNRMNKQTSDLVFDWAG
ncbi:L,D-transpeptidase [Bacillus sp. KH172YL63]|uniref:L,D-transpeptidase n=1 Tax=Bacillus sp. KH172YL63 TaxID=2709784 RepID=UPI0013E43DC4|nr:L,D-transpeptidase [Bacillus sp. KH172YL63]BCB06061.1 hypothetical protein KH172YL63_41940 [Bacillus sp. KH172YL63]